MSGTKKRLEVYSFIKFRGKQKGIQFWMPFFMNILIVPVARLKMSNLSRVTDFCQLKDCKQIPKDDNIFKNGKHIHFRFNNNNFKFQQKTNSSLDL